MVKPGYKQTQVGIIPDDWKCKEANDEIDEISMGPFGSDIPVSCFTSEGIPVLNGRSVSQAALIDEFKNFVTAEKAKSLKKAVAFRGDIVVTHRGTIGQISFIPLTSRYERYVISQSQFRVRFNLSTFNPHFVVAYFLSPKGQDALLEKKGHTGVPALAQPTTNFRKLHIPCPPLAEQERIVYILSEVDELILSLEKTLLKKKAIKQGAMQELLTGKKRLPGFFGKIAFQPLKSLCSTFADGDWIEAKDQSNDGVRLIQTGNVGKGRYIDKQDKQRFISTDVFHRLHCLEVFEGDVLISRLPEPAGRACILPPCSKRRITAVDCTVVRFSSYNPLLFIVYSQTKQYQEKVEMAMAGSTRQRISRKELGEIPIPVFPTKEEQNAIASIFANMDSEIEALEQKLEKYRQVKQGMMQQLLTGKIRLLNTASVIQQTEPVTSLNGQPQKPAHNRQFEDAVTIAAIVDTFYSDKYPLGRVKVQKLLYLLHRHQAISVSDFKKKAAGPYADTVRYRGGEPIAKKNEYINSDTGKQGTIYFKGENIAQALEYVERWGMQADVEWLKENFSYTSRNDLELFATVDMAMCDLNEAGIPISVASIKSLIASDKEWKAKLKKSFFSDSDIARAIKKCNELFG